MELEKLSALKLGGLVRAKKVSPVEVIRYFADRIEKRNPSLNAFTYTRIDEALDRAYELEDRLMKGDSLGVFAGVPVALKDFLPSKKGWPASHGGVKSLQTIDPESGMFCKAAESQDAIVIGKTNAPAFGFRGTTDNKMYGPTSTPFKIGYNSGGSSGGSAAAVGDGLVGLAEGGDAGGSVRIPAAWCGVFGFKPSAGLIPSVCRPDAWTATHPYCCGGPEARTVSDAAAILSAMCRYDPRDPLCVPLEYPFGYNLNLLRDLKIGYTFNFDLFPNCESEIQDAMAQIFPILSDVGVKCVEPVNFTWHYSRQEIEDAWLLGINIDDSLNEDIVKVVAEHPEDVPDEFLKWHERAKNATMLDYRKFHDIRTDILDAHQDVFDNYDIILAPVSGCLPVPNADDFNTRGPKTISGQPVDDLIGFGYTYLENMIGTPAASVPIGLSKDGLPIGLQVIAPRYKDSVALAFCRALEIENPWSYDIPYNRM